MTTDDIPGINEPAMYDGHPIVTPIQRWTMVQKMELLDTHPLFTGRCPNCEIPMQETEPPRVHWDCTRCDWVDDRI